MRKAKFVIEIIFFNFTDLLHFSTLRHNWSLLVLISFHCTVDPLSADHLAQTIKFFYANSALPPNQPDHSGEESLISYKNLFFYPAIWSVCFPNCSLFTEWTLQFHLLSKIVLLDIWFILKIPRSSCSWQLNFDARAEPNKRIMLMILLEIQQTGAFWSPHRWGGWRHPLRI